MIVLSFLIWTSCVVHKPRIEGHSIKKFFEHSRKFDHSFTGFALYDPQHQRMIFSYNAGKYFTPASNAKLFTYYTGIKTISGAIPALHYCIENDTLFFSGTADPTFLHPDFNMQPAYDFLKNNDIPLVFYPRQFEDQRFGPGWAWDDYPFYYSPEKAAFPIYGNVVHIKKDSADRNISVLPSDFETMVRFSHDTLEDSAYFELNRAEFDNRFEIKTQNLPEKIDEVIPFRYSDTLFIRLLQDTLHLPVITIHHKPHCVVKTIFSQPVDTLMRHMLIPSDNFIAEQILLMSSGILFDTLSTTRIIDFAEKHYFPQLKDDIFLVDGSGLSRYNLVKPIALVKLLEMILKDVPQNKLDSLLPSNGKRGTLKNAFISNKPYIFAKTGSMGHVYNLSGYIKTDKGKTLIFSFMNNNFNCSAGVIKQEMEKVLRAIKEKY